MIARGSGHLAYVNSPAAIVAWPGAAAYTAARWALRGFAEALRADLHGTRIEVTSAIPGWVSSSYFDHNPGVVARAPGLARLLPRLTPEQAAERLLRGIERGERLILTPRALKMLYLAHAVAPWLVRRLVLATGARRPAGSAP
jgi:short-subunit dehydrogenase